MNVFIGKSYVTMKGLYGPFCLIILHIEECWAQCRNGITFTTGSLLHWRSYLGNKNNRHQWLVAESNQGQGAVWWSEALLQQAISAALSVQLMQTDMKPITNVIAVNSRSFPLKHLPHQAYMEMLTYLYSRLQLQLTDL